ncbi:hypothetical protein ACFOKK_08335 [Sphingobium fuliginis]
MRALIIAPSIIATPVAASAATGLVCIPTANRGTWDAVMQQFTAAKIAGAEYDRSHVFPLYEAMKAEFGSFALSGEGPMRERCLAWRSAHNFGAITDQAEAYADAEYDARVELLRMPAPDLAALRWKLDETFADDEIALWCDDIADAIREDILRLMPKGA